MSTNANTNAGNTSVILLGLSNFNDWLRSFKIIAIGNRIWDLLNGTEKILQKPNKADYTIVETPKKIEYEGYKLDLVEFKEQETKIRQALFALAKSVHAAIADEIIEMKDPAAAFNHVQNKHKMNDITSLQMAQSKIDSLRLDDFESLGEYLCAIQIAKADIIAAGESISDAEIRSKILAGLSPVYNRFVESYHTAEASNDAFISILLWYGTYGLELATRLRNKKP